MVIFVFKQESSFFMAKRGAVSKLAEHHWKAIQLIEEGKYTMKEIAEAVLQGKPPLPRDSPYLDKYGDFIPQKVDILSSIGSSEQLKPVRDHFISELQYIALVFKINE